MLRHGNYLLAVREGRLSKPGFVGQQKKAMRNVGMVGTVIIRQFSIYIASGREIGKKQRLLVYGSTEFLGEVEMSIDVVMLSKLRDIKTYVKYIEDTYKSSFEHYKDEFTPDINVDIKHVNALLDSCIKSIMDECRKRLDQYDSVGRDEEKLR